MEFMHYGSGNLAWARLKLPNMRVQRTRGLALLGALTSFARSPLTRHPLGGQGSGLA